MDRVTRSWFDPITPFADYVAMSASSRFFRYVLLGLFVALGSLPAQAQQRGGMALPTSISGTVTEAATGDPIPSATVEVRHAADSSLVTGAITREDGAFEIESVRPGTYYVRVSFVGYEPQVIPDVALTRAQPRADLGTIELEEDTAQLDEVEVSAEREYMEVGIDRTVYNVENQPVTAGGSGRDVLENIPSVEVDVEGNISLRGSQSVAIYLNGKPAPMQGDALTSFLEGLSDDDIQRVEVIPNPSARYDPEGMSGIINIVLAKNRERGWGGGVSASASTQGEYNGSANGHYRSGPWNVYANYSLRHGERDFSGTRSRENLSEDALLVPFLKQEMEGDGGGLSNTFNATVDYQLDRRSTLSLTSIFSHRDNDGGERTRYLEYDAGRTLDSLYNRLSDNESTDLSMDYRLTYMRIVRPREHELSVEARYEQDREDEFEVYTERVLPVNNPDADGMLIDRQEVDQDEREREASLEVNYVRPLFGSLRLDAGYDGEYEQEENSLFSRSGTSEDDLEVDEDLNDQFDYTEQTHALYGVLAGEMGKFGAQFGLRAEKALTEFNQQKLGETFDHDYFSLFPSAHVTYEPVQGNTFKVSYSKRVRRPSTWQLNPLPDYDDPRFRRQGNPELDPEYTHSMEVSYSRLGEQYTVSLSPYYRRTVDEISWYETLRPDGVTVLTFENFETATSYGTELIGSLTLGQWLRGTASINAYKQVTEGGNEVSQLSSDALGFRSRVSATFTLRPGLSMQVSQFYRSPMDIPGGHIDAFTMTDVAVQQRLMGGKASLSLRASDVFDTMGFQVERNMPDYYMTFSREPNRRALQLTFRYNFGQQDRDQRRRDQAPRGDDEPEDGGYGGM